MTKEQLGVCDAVSKHFHVTKAATRAQAAEYLKDNGESPVVEIDTPQGRLLVGTSKNSMLLGQMLFFKYLKKTELFSDTTSLLVNMDVEFVAFYSKGALLAIHTDLEYNGLGGVFVKSDRAANGFIIEPIAHYLEHKYPVYSEE